MENYLPILIFAVFSMGFLVVTLVAAKLFRPGGALFPAASGAVNDDPYECGNPAESYAHDHRFSIRYYLIAVLFVVFDVETIFLFPWAVQFDRLGLFGFVEMIIFLVILIVGYVYAWKRGALTWA